LINPAFHVPDGVQRFQMTAFETRDHLVYFVSDLPSSRTPLNNWALAPQVRDFSPGLEL